MASYINIGTYSSIVGTIGTTTTSIDSSIADQALITKFDGVVTLATPSAPMEAWFQVHSRKQSMAATSGANAAIITLYNTNGDVLISINSVSNTATHNVSILGGSNITLIIANSILDIHCITNNTGTGVVEIYQDSTLITNQTGLTNGTFGIDRLELRGTHITSSNNNTTMYYHRFITGVGNSPTVGKVAYHKAPISNGTDTTWTGDITDIDEGIGVNDGLVITSSATTERESFNAAPISQSSSLIAVGIQSTASQDALGTVDYQHTIKIGGTDYDQGLVTPTGSLLQYTTITTTNPSSGTTWTVAEFNAAEYGVVSA